MSSAYRYGEKPCSIEGNGCLCGDCVSRETCKQILCMICNPDDKPGYFDEYAMICGPRIECDKFKRKEI